MSLDRKQNFFTKIKFVNLLLAVLIVSSGFSYLVSINKLVVSGFKLQSLRQKVEALSSENEAIAAQQVSLESYANLEQKIKDLKMVAVDKIDYITPAPEVLAKQ